MSVHKNLVIVQLWFIVSISAVARWVSLSKVMLRAPFFFQCTNSQLKLLHLLLYIFLYFKEAIWPLQHSTRSLLLYFLGILPPLTQRFELLPLSSCYPNGIDSHGIYNSMIALSFLDDSFQIYNVRPVF